MKFLPWLMAAIAIGAASFLFFDSQELARQRDALGRQLDQARAAAVAVENARIAQQEARKAADLAQQKALEAARYQAETLARGAAASARNAEKAARAAQQKAEVAARAAERAAGGRELAERLATEKAALEAERARVAVEMANAERMAAEARAASERARQANAINSIPQSEAHSAAMALEAEGRGQDAVKLYIRAARSGSCEAAARLGEIYDKGLVGVSRNYAESLKWYNAARVLGCDASVPPRRS
jgi:hypothetical protein